jgi:DNA-directed RNA polymerase subunit RPC12/RpoP
MKYCNECGKKLKSDKAEICTNCGVRVQALNTKTKHPKSKGVAVFLAIIFSFWTWCYTYDKDYVKFWVGLIACIIGLGFFFVPNLIVWVASLIDSIGRSSDFYENYEV